MKRIPISVYVGETHECGGSVDIPTFVDAEKLGEKFIVTLDSGWLKSAVIRMQVVLRDAVAEIKVSDKVARNAACQKVLDAADWTNLFSGLRMLSETRIKVCNGLLMAKVAKGTATMETLTVAIALQKAGDLEKLKSFFLEHTPEAFE